MIDNQNNLLRFLFEQTKGTRVNAADYDLMQVAERNRALSQFGVTFNVIEAWCYERVGSPSAAERDDRPVNDNGHPQTLQDLIVANLVEPSPGPVGRSPRYQLTPAGIQRAETLKSRTPATPASPVAPTRGKYATRTDAEKAAEKAAE